MDFHMDVILKLTLLILLQPILVSHSVSQQVNEQIEQSVYVKVYDLTSAKCPQRNRPQYNAVSSKVHKNLTWKGERRLQHSLLVERFAASSRFTLSKHGDHIQATVLPIIVSK
jgi:hypothetical protein